jgi:hypothetical protein
MTPQDDEFNGRPMRRISEHESVSLSEEQLNAAWKPYAGSCNLCGAPTTRRIGALAVSGDRFLCCTQHEVWLIPEHVCEACDARRRRLLALARERAARSA